MFIWWLVWFVVQLVNLAQFATAKLFIIKGDRESWRSTRKCVKPLVIAPTKVTFPSRNCYILRIPETSLSTKYWLDLRFLVGTVKLIFTFSFQWNWESD